MKHHEGILLAIWIGLLSSLAGAVNVTTLWLVAIDPYDGQPVPTSPSLSTGGWGDDQPSGLDLAGLYGWEHFKRPLIL